MELVYVLALVAFIWYFGKVLNKLGQFSEKAMITGISLGDNRLSVLEAESKIAKADRFAALTVNQETVAKAKANAKILEDLDF